MKKNFKKRLAAFKVGLVLSIMITPFCFYKLSTPVQAAVTNVITYNNYGSFSRTNSTFVYNVGSGDYSLGASSVVGELNGIYNGTVTINYSIGNGLTISNFSVIPENCHIISYSSSAMTIEFYGVDNWTVTFTETLAEGIQQASNVFSDLTINSLTGWNMTYLERSDSAVMVNIQNRLSDLKTYTDNLENLVSQNQTLLNTIASNTSVSTGSTINNINIDLAYVKQSQDSILGSLLDFLSDSVGNIVTLSTLIDHIDQVKAQTQANTAKLTDIYNQLDAINTTLSNIDSNIENIDDTLDIITWNTYEVNLSWSNELNGTYNTSVVPSNTYRTLFIKVPLVSNVDPSIYRLRFYLFGGTYNDRRIEVRNVYYNGNIIDIGTYVSQGGNNEIFLYSPQIARELIIEVYNPSNYYLSFNPSTNNFHDVFFIRNTDIEYWQLLHYFEDYNHNVKELERLVSIDNKLTTINTGISSAADRVVNAINAININPSDVTSNDIENVVNDYDTNFELINDVETDLSDLFDRNIDGFNSMINNNYNPIVTDLQDGTTFLNRFFVTFSKFDIIKPWFYLALIGLVLFVLLG